MRNIYNALKQNEVFSKQLKICRKTLINDIFNFSDNEKITACVICLEIILFLKSCPFNASVTSFSKWKFLFN